MALSALRRTRITDHRNEILHTTQCSITTVLALLATAFSTQYHPPTTPIRQRSDSLQTWVSYSKSSSSLYAVLLAKFSSTWRSHFTIAIKCQSSQPGANASQLSSPILHSSTHSPWLNGLEQVWSWDRHAWKCIWATSVNRHKQRSRSQTDPNINTCEQVLDSTCLSN